MDTRSKMPFTPCLEDFRQTVVDIPISQNSLSVLKRYGGNVAEFYKDKKHLFGSTSVSLNFTSGLSSGKTHTADWYFVSCHYWYSQVVSPVIMSQTQGDLPPSNFLSMWVHQSILPCFCSSLRLLGTQRAQQFPYAKLAMKSVSETSRWNLHDIPWYDVFFWGIVVVSSRQWVQKQRKIFSQRSQETSEKLSAERYQESAAFLRDNMDEEGQKSI